MIKTIIVTSNDNCSDIQETISKSEIFENTGEIYLSDISDQDPVRRLKKTLAKCDAVFIDSINNFPYNILELLIKKSKHILIFNFPELKPNEISQLSKLAGEADVKIQVFQKNRYNSVLRDNSKLITTPILIEVTRDFHSIGNTEDCTPVTKKIFEDLDNVLYLIRSNVNKVNASGIAISGDTPDIINLRLEFENGSVACFSINNFGEKDKYQYQFYLKGKSIKADLVRNISQIHTFDFHGFDIKKEIQHNGLDYKENNFYLEETKSFAKYIQKDLTSGITLDDVYYKYCIAERIMDKMNRKFSLVE